MYSNRRDEADRSVLSLNGSDETLWIWSRLYANFSEKCHILFFTPYIWTHYWGTYAAVLSTTDARTVLHYCCAIAQWRFTTQVYISRMILSTTLYIFCSWHRYLLYHTIMCYTIAGIDAEVYYGYIASTYYVSSRHTRLLLVRLYVLRALRASVWFTVYSFIDASVQ